MLRNCFFYLCVWFSLVPNMHANICTKNIESIDSTERFLKTNLTQEDYDKIAKLKRQNVRGDILALRINLEKVQDILNKTDVSVQDIKRTIDNTESTINPINSISSINIIAEIKRLCEKLDINDLEIDWIALSEILDLDPSVRAGCPACGSTCTAFNTILMKLDEIQMNLMGGGSVFGIPITQADIPFTASTTGQAYAVTEPLTQTGSATPAITIAGDCITVDMGGNRLAVTSMTAPAVQLTGMNATITNGAITTDGSSSAINIASAATNATITNMAISSTAAGSADLVSSPGPEYATMTVTSFAVASGSSGSAIAFGPGTSTGTQISDVVITGSSVGPAPAISITDSSNTTIAQTAVAWASSASVVTPGVISIAAVGSQGGLSVTDTYITGSGDAGLDIDSISGILASGVVVDSSVITVFGNNDGIKTTNSPDGVIQDSLCVSCATAYSVGVGSSDYLLSNNSAVSCSVGYGCSGGQTTIEYCYATACSVGYSIISSDDYKLESNSANTGDLGNPTSVAYSLASVNNAMLQNNVAVSYPTAFAMDAASSKVTFEENSAMLCGTGLEIAGSDIVLESNSVNGGILVNPLGSGISLSGVTNAILCNNNIVSQGYASLILSSSKIIFCDNSVSACNEGVSINMSDDIIVEDNNVLSGIALSGSGFGMAGCTNVVYKNNIVSSWGFFGFDFAASNTGITVEGNVATNCGTGLKDLGSTASVYANNTANNNTTDYIGVPNTFSLAALGTEEYWHNAGA